MYSSTLHNIIGALKNLTTNQNRQPSHLTNVPPRNHSDKYNIYINISKMQYVSMVKIIFF